MSFDLQKLCLPCRSEVFNVDSFAQLCVGSELEDDTTGIWLTRSLATASKRCTFCRLVEGLLSEAGTGDAEHLAIRIYATSVQGREATDLSVLFLDAGERGCRRYMIHAEPDDPASQSISTRRPESEVDSPAAFQVARGWLRDCDEQHEQCRREKISRLPTRVLDVGATGDGNGQDDEESLALRLFVTNSITAPYAALSYCWGAPQPQMLVTAKLEAYQQGIDISTLPASIRDAVRVMRQLGLRYLWVDSLCIIQDSAADKAAEIAHMGALYRDAHITIQAAGAKTCEDGFLDRQQHVLTAPSTDEVILPYFGPTPGSMVLRPWTARTDYEPAADPAAARAWIFQERMLSARILTYPSVPHPLQWQCASLRASNGGPLPPDAEPGSERLWPDLERPPTPPRSVAQLMGQDDDEDMPQDDNAKLDRGRNWLWYTIVRDYSARGLGEPADKLPAIAGVAAEFARARTFENTGPYCAGLWRNDMPTELLWGVHTVPRYNGVQYGTDPGVEEEESDGAATKKVAYRAPSWSWAAVDCQVMLSTQGPVYPHDFEILACDVQPELPVVAFGRVRSASLTVRALLRQAVWNKHSRVLRSVNSAEGDDDSSSTIAPVIGTGVPDAYFAHGTVNVWCMPVLKATRYLSYQKTGLLLEKCGEEYKRVGALKLQAHDFFEDCSQQVVTII